LSLRIPLTPDQTLQTEFHEIERRLRKLEKETGTSAGSSIRIVNTGGGTGAVNLQPIYDRIKAIEDNINNLPSPITSDFGGVGPSSVHGLVPAPGVPQPPTGVAGHVLLEDGTWGFPFRGLVSVVTSGAQTDPPYDVVDIATGLSVGNVQAADIECYNLNVRGAFSPVDSVDLILSTRIFGG
jgi:hypothetical protein